MIVEEVVVVTMETSTHPEPHHSIGDLEPTLDRNSQRNEEYTGREETKPMDSPPPRVSYLVSNELVKVSLLLVHDELTMIT